MTKSSFLCIYFPTGKDISIHQLLHLLQKHALIYHAGDTPDGFPLLENNKRRNRLNPILIGNWAVFIYIDLQHPSFSGDLFSQGFHYRSHRFARPAPRSIEIDQHRLITAYDILKIFHIL